MAMAARRPLSLASAHPGADTVGAMVRTPRLMLLSALGCVGAFGVLLALAYYVPAARWLDQASLYGFIQLDRGPLDTLANGLAHVCDPLPVAILGTAGIVAAAATRGLRYGAAAAVLLVGANVSSQVLKPLLAHSRPITVFDGVHIQNAAYPSGHATASMTLALAAVMLTPRAQRPLVAVIGGAFSLTISFSVSLGPAPRTACSIQTVAATATAIPTASR